MGLFRFGTGSVRPGMDANNPAIGPIKPRMYGRLVSRTRTGPLGSDISLLMQELGPIILRWALSGLRVRYLWQGTGPLRLVSGSLRLGTGPS